MARPKKLNVTLTRTGNQWIATVVGDKSLTIGGVNTRTARLRISNLVEEKYGGPVELEFHIELPAEQKAILDKHLAREHQLQQLINDVPVDRIRVAEELLSHHLTQEEVAKMLGLSQGHLAVMMKREATTGTVPRNTRRSTR